MDLLGGRGRSHGRLSGTAVGVVSLRGSHSRPEATGIQCPYPLANQRDLEATTIRELGDVAMQVA